MKIFKKLFTLMMAATLMSFVLVGCGGVNDATDAKSTTQETTSESETGDTGDDLGDDVGDAAEDVGDAVGDVAEGAGDAVGDLIDGSNGFDNYDDAHDYFLQRMGAGNADAKYEVRNESKDLTSYDNENEGYSFELYDTAGNKDGERIGQFYVDSKTGKIYHKNEKKNKVEEYKQAGTSDTGTEKNGNTDTGAGGTNATDDNGTGSGTAK